MLVDTKCNNAYCTINNNSIFYCIHDNDIYSSFLLVTSCSSLGITVAAVAVFDSKRILFFLFCSSVNGLSMYRPLAIPRRPATTN